MAEKKTTQEEKEYIVKVPLLNVRDEQDEIVKEIREGEIFTGTKKGTKIINDEGLSVVAKFVKEKK